MCIVNCRLSTPKHFDLTDIQQTIIPPSELKPNFKGSFCSVELVENKYASERKGEKLAVQVIIQGHSVGFVPELASVAKWQGEDSQWFKDVEQVRGQLFADYDNHNTTQWPANVSHVRYVKEEVVRWTDPDVVHCMDETHVLDSRQIKQKKWIEYPEFCMLPPEAQGSWKIDAICISMED